LLQIFEDGLVSIFSENEKTKNIFNYG